MNPKEIIDTIIKQYTDCTQMLEDLYQIAPEQSWKNNGIGSCDITKGESEHGITGIARYKLIDKREILKGKTEPESDALCPYHQRDWGCILGNLKSPLCISVYIEGELKHEIDTKYIQNTLKTILEGGLEDGGILNPEVNEELVDEFILYVDNIKKRHKKQS